MNRDPQVSLWLERVSTFDRHYAEQLNELAAIDDLDALEAPFHDLSEQECLAVVAGVEAELATLEAPKSGRQRVQRVAPGAAMQQKCVPLDALSRAAVPDSGESDSGESDSGDSDAAVPHTAVTGRRLQRPAVAPVVQRVALAATGVALAAALVLLVSGTLFTNTLFDKTLTSRPDASLPEYVLRPPRADSSRRGAEPVGVEPGSPPTYTIGRALEFVLQPRQRTDFRPRMWAFDAREPERTLPGLEMSFSDGGGIVAKLSSAQRDWSPRPGFTELVLLVGQDVGRVPSPEVVSGTASPPDGFQRLTFPLRWVSADSSVLPLDLAAPNDQRRRDDPATR